MTPKGAFGTLTSAMKARHAVRLASAVAALLVGTAATCGPPYQRVYVHSNPPGAEVYLDQELVGTTPLQLRIGTGRAHAVYLKKEGFRPELVVLENHQPPDGIDFLTPADVRVRLIPQTGPAGRELEVAPEGDRAP